MYLESVAIIPQLYMFQRSSNNRGVVEVLISHCVSALGKRRVAHAATCIHHSLYSVCIILTDDLYFFPIFTFPGLARVWDMVRLLRF